MCATMAWHCPSCAAVVFTARDVIPTDVRHRCDACNGHLAVNRRRQELFVIAADESVRDAVVRVAIQAALDRIRPDLDSDGFVLDVVECTAWTVRIRLGGPSPWCDAATANLQELQDILRREVDEFGDRSLILESQDPATD